MSRSSLNTLGSPAAQDRKCAQERHMISITCSGLAGLGHFSIAVLTRTKWPRRRSQDAADRYDPACCASNVHTSRGYSSKQRQRNFALHLQLASISFTLQDLQLSWKLRVLELPNQLPGSNHLTSCAYGLRTENSVASTLSILLDGL